jgi:pimeloyl-ACP methyl ester carboxylesterase
MASRDCPAHDLRSRIEMFADELDRKPHDVPVTLADGTPTTLRYDGASIGSVAFGAMYPSSSISSVPATLLTYTFPGTLDTLAPDDAASLALAGELAEGLMLSTFCREDAPFAHRQPIEPTPSYFRGSEFTRDDPATACEGWHAGAAPDAVHEPVRSAVPTLLIVGEFDPITPPWLSHLAAETLTHARVVEMRGAGHDADSLPCAQRVIRQFLNDPQADLDMRCVDALPAPDFGATQPVAQGS